jgi:hypothetical protein
MKLSSYFATLLGIMICTNANAQVTFKTEYYGMSNYQDRDRNDIGSSKGSAVVYEGSANLPISIKVNEKNQPSIWALGIGGAYVSLNNKNFIEDLVLSEIVNLQIGIMHMRPISEKWSMMANLGIGVFSPDTRFSEFTFQNVGNLGVIFIRNIKPNLSVGGGLAINNTFGYPMVFPTLFLDWKYEGNFIVKVSMMEGGKIYAGYNVNKSLTLSLFTGVNGQGAFFKKDGKNMIFTHQCMEVGLCSEFKVGKGFIIPISIGGAMRDAYYAERRLKSFFSGGSGGFDVAPAVSIGIKYGMN